MTLNELKKYYTGKNASEYDEKRKKQSSWEKENEVVNLLLKRTKINKGTVLDIPVGTGRFFELYKNSDLSVVGIDISDDMLLKAREKAKKIGLNPVLMQDNLLTLSTKKKADIVICIRFLNFIPPKNLKIVLNNLIQLTNQWLILGVKLHSKKNKYFSLSYIKHKIYIY